VRNAEFTSALGHALHRPAIFPVPAFVARAAFGEMSDALLLSSQKVAPQRLEGSRYHYVAPELNEALSTVLYKVT
jgi:NAD dependent epimerase/dehydratase family enzyme